MPNKSLKRTEEQLKDTVLDILKALDITSIDILKEIWAILSADDIYLLKKILTKKKMDA
jgi:hypothetical protein